MNPAKEKLILSKSNSWKMFDEISSRYDFLNNILSFGLHHHWRNKLAENIFYRKKGSVLDLATGTADVLLTIADRYPDLQRFVGIDLAEKMLNRGRKKIRRTGLEGKICLKSGDATKIPLEDCQFDNVTMSFGIRNVSDHYKVLSEMYRILNINGRAIILEFSLPKNYVWRTLHISYLRYLIPIIGFIVSGHYKAYKYLNQTIESFPYGQEFCQHMQASGFQNVHSHQLLMGIATIYVGEKH